MTSAYKYFPPERVDVIENQELRFSHIKSLNDPFEFHPVISRIMDKADADRVYEKYFAPEIAKIEDRKLTIHDIPAEYRSQLPPDVIQQITNFSVGQALEAISAFHPKNLLPTFLAEITETAGATLSSAIRGKMQNMFGVLSLSQVRDHLTMWSHYARDHKGFVIEFNSDNSFFDCRKSPTDPIRCLQKVKYETERPNIKLFDTTLPEEDMLAFLVEKILLTKSVHWQYEEEVRMIRPLSETTRVLEKEGQRIHLQHFDTSVVQAIYLGVNASEHTQQQIATMVGESRYHHVQVYRSVLSTSHYSLDFVPI